MLYARIELILSIERLRGSRCTGWWAWKHLRKMLSIDWSEEGRRPHSVG